MHSCTGETSRAFLWTPDGVLDVCVPRGGIVPQRFLWVSGSFLLAVSWVVDCGLCCCEGLPALSSSGVIGQNPTAGGDELGFCLAGAASACTCVLVSGREVDDDY